MVPAQVPAIIENIIDATIPVEGDSDLTDEQKDAKARRGRAIRQATAAQFYAAETVERVSFYELFAPERRDFTLTFGTEHGQTFAIDAAPKAPAEPEEEELAPVRLGEQEDNFAAGIVDLALMAAQNDDPDLDRTVWDMVTSNVKIAVKVIHNVESGGAESLAEVSSRTPGIDYFEHRVLPGLAPALRDSGNRVFFKLRNSSKQSQCTPARHCTHTSKRARTFTTTQLRSCRGPRRQRRRRTRQQPSRLTRERAASHLCAEHRRTSWYAAGLVPASPAGRRRAVQALEAHRRARATLHGTTQISCRARLRRRERARRGGGHGGARGLGGGMRKRRGSDVRT